MHHQINVTVALIVACAQNGTIGRNNRLPWHLPNDLKHFKSVTMGKPIIMGRKTYESIGKPLPGRTNIVVTKSWSDTTIVPGLNITDNFEDALEIASRVAERGGAKEIMVIGGAKLYEHALPWCQRIYLTEVHADIAGDSFFRLPDRDAAWTESSRKDFSAGDSNDFDYSFCVLERRPMSA